MFNRGLGGADAMIEALEHIIRRCIRHGGFQHGSWPGFCPACAETARNLKRPAHANSEEHEPVRPLEALIAEKIEEWREKARWNQLTPESQPHMSDDLKSMALCWAEARRECADELTALLQAAAPPAPTVELEQQPICVACSGCGWCEGSPAFTCPVCKGTGYVH